MVIEKGQSMLIQYDYGIVDMIISEHSIIIREQYMLIKEWPMLTEEKF